MAITAKGPDTLVSGQEFARTYSNRVYDDPWEAVCDYHEVQAFKREHPDIGTRPVARYFNLPRGRVGPWLGDSKPDPVRGIEAAEEHGWVNVDPGSDTFRGLNVLVAWVFTGGSIAKKTFVPMFIVKDHRDVPFLTKAAVLAGVDLDFTRKTASPRSQEMRPVEHPSILGRVLTVLGAPTGEKRDGATIRLPDYLHHVHDNLAQEFLQTVLHNRSQQQDGTEVIVFAESRDPLYLRSVARLVRRLTGERATVSEGNVELSSAASREIAVWDPLLGVE